MKLPTEPIEPESDNPRTLLLYGPPKIGKTTILSGLQDNFMIDIEDGSEFVTAMKVKCEGFSAPSDEKKKEKKARWKENTFYLNEIGKEIMKNGKPYDFITLDTVTKLEEWCEKSSLVKYKKTPQGAGFQGRNIKELEYGLGYGLLRDEFKYWMNKVSKLSEHTILVGHVKDNQITKDGDQVNVKDINLTGQLKSIASANVDAVGYMYIDPDDNSKRRISFLTDDEIVCGNRCPRLEGEDFVISEKKEDGSIDTHWDKIFV